MKKNKWKWEDIAYPALKTLFSVGSLLFMGGAIVILYTLEDFVLFLGFMGFAAAYLTMFFAVVLSEMTTDELKKNQNKIIKKLNKIIKRLEKKKP